MVRTHYLGKSKGYKIKNILIRKLTFERIVVCGFLDVSTKIKTMGSRCGIGSETLSYIVGIKRLLLSFSVSPIC